MNKYTLTILIIVLIWTITAADLNIIFTNDTHGAYLPKAVKTSTGIDSIGGYFNLYKTLPKENQFHRDGRAAQTLWLDAGDQQTGSVFASYRYKGVIGGAVIEIFNKLGLDAATFGNHEFDQSWKNTEKLIKMAKFPFLSANLVWKKNGKPITGKPYKIFSKGKLKIGVIGLTLTELPEKVKSANVKDITVLPYKQAIDKYIDKLDKKTDLIILLTHNGWQADSLLATQLDDRVDIIIGGHSHNAFYKPQIVNKIFILQSGAYLNYVGYVKIKVENDQIKIIEPEDCLIPVSSTNSQKADKNNLYAHSSNMSCSSKKTYFITSKPINPIELKSFIDQINKEIEQDMDTVIGHLQEDWIPDKYASTTVSRWQAKALYRHYQDKYKPDIALLNCGGIRKSILQGTITKRDIQEMLPFSNYIVIFSCYGKDLEAFWHHNQKIMQTKEHDIVEAYNLTQIAEPILQDSLVFRLMVDGKPIIKDKIYRIVSHDYLAGQSEKYLNFKPFEIVETGDLILEVMIQEIMKQKPEK